jgi:hypothetical protein
LVITEKIIIFVVEKQMKKKDEKKLQKNLEYPEKNIIFVVEKGNQ